MDVTRKPGRTFADEHVIGVDPPMRPELPGFWRRRLNAFTGRAVSDKALTAEQDVRSGMQRLQGLALSPGSVEGLEVLLDPGAPGKAPGEAFFQVAPGLGIARSGEDVSIGAPRRMAFGAVPVILRSDHADALEGAGAPAGDAAAAADPVEDGAVAGMAARLRPALPRRLGRTLAEIAANPESAQLPHVAILVAQPVTATVLGREVDDCRPDPRDDAYVDLRRVDGSRLALYLWPAEMTAIAGGPDYALPAPGPEQRNRIAYSVFDNEKLLLPDEMHPWEEWGVPLGVAAFDGDWKLAFVDRFAVARVGGTPHARTPLVPAAGDARLWQARIDQFVAQIAEMPVRDEASLAGAFVRMPPVGLLPPDMFDPVLRRQSFFPGSFGVSAVPVPHSNLNLAIREAAPLASFNRSVPDRVELLVPVPDAVYDPGLLEIALEDPRFAEAVAAFRADRGYWLTRREAGRRRQARLRESMSGQIIGWPSSDLTIEENSPAPHVQVPVEFSRTRRFDEQTAARTHSMSGANATLPVAKSDTIWFWVRIHKAKDLTGLSLRLGSPTRTKLSLFSHGVFWGEANAMPIAGEGNGLAARRVGDLPEAGIWHRLEIPASAIWSQQGTGLDGISINGVEFTQRGGHVEWGSFGKLDASGAVFTYIGDDAPAGAVLGVVDVTGRAEPGWPWQQVPGREALDVPDFGTVSENGVRRVAALDGFRAKWNQPFLAGDIAEVDETGISAFLTKVEARLKATNDAIDLGFVRARSDIYRVRQIMLGADAASRLVTSPSLADLASRDEGARATSKGISDFLRASVTRSPTETILDVPARPASAAGGGTSGTGGTGGTGGTSGGGLRVGGTALRSAVLASPMTLNISAARMSSFGAISATRTVFPGPSASATTAMFTGAPLLASLPLTVIQPTFARPAQSALLQSAVSISGTRLLADENRYRPRDIQLHSPIAGLVERTVSVAERLTTPPAVQALNYALASKAAVIAALSGLASSDRSRPDGIPLDDLMAPGFRSASRTAADPGPPPTLGVLIADRAKVTREWVDADEIPTNTDKHESDYFTAAVQAIDNSVAIMRLVEGRVALFESLNADLRDLRDELLQRAEEAAAWLRAIDVEVQEARHDLGAADRLRTEEKGRIEATNSRRAAVLAGHVGAIAWRRVREADNRSLAPVLEIASGLAENPILACRRDYDDVPDEIHDYVELMRDAPVKWFPRIAAEVQRINRLEAAVAALEKMQERAAIPLFYHAAPPAGVATKVVRGVQQALAVQRLVVEERRSMVSQINLSALPSLSLAQAHVQIRETASLADLIGGRHRQPTLTRMAGEEMEGIAQVAGCLHSGFGEVAPAIRLGWAEILSEFDRPAPLASLAGLPGWPEVPLELKRTLQSFVDWLFQRIDRTNQQAMNAMNELVRIAVLMAAHAPVDRVIPARLVAPVPARVGGRFELALDISRIRKGMMAEVRDRDDRIVSTAVIADIIDGHASATILRNFAQVTTISSDMRFHLIGGAG
jgi:hypothetical protein